MNERARRTRDELARAQEAMAQAERGVANLEAACHHRWPEKPTYDPVRTKGYMAQNWMGPIRDGKPALPDVYVEPTEKARWKRECLECGKVEHTEQTTEQVTKTPRFT